MGSCPDTDIDPIFWITEREHRARMKTVSLVQALSTAEHYIEHNTPQPYPPLETMSNPGGRLQELVTFKGLHHNG